MTAPVLHITKSAVTVWVSSMFLKKGEHFVILNQRIRFMRFYQLYSTWNVNIPRSEKQKSYSSSMQQMVLFLPNKICVYAHLWITVFFTFVKIFNYTDVSILLSWKEELNNCNCFFFVSWISIVEMYTTQTSLYFKRYVLNLCNYF